MPVDHITIWRLVEEVFGNMSKMSGYRRDDEISVETSAVHICYTRPRNLVISAVVGRGVLPA